MPESNAILDQQFLEMRWRCLSLAADLDRLERSASHGAITDPRMATLTQAIAALLQPGPDRAQRVQMLFSDRSPGPHAP